MNWTEERQKSNERKVEIFKYMIQFLEIYGSEHFGQSAEVNWSTVWDFCSKCDILDFNTEVEDLVYNTNDENFRDEVFLFVEKQAIEGYPIWRLFNMSKWLYDKCEEELIQNEHKKDIDYFTKTKCYRCKHFQCKLQILYETMLEPCVMGEYDNVQAFKNEYTNAGVKQISHNMSCGYRENILVEALDKEKKRAFHVWENDFKREYKFKYAKFNYDDESQPEYSKDWFLNPSVLIRCPYFEESNMTPEKFEELWHEIPRYQ